MTEIHQGHKTWSRHL